MLGRPQQAAALQADLLGRTGGGERGGSVFGVYITGQVPNSTTVAPVVISSLGVNVEVTGQGGGLDTSIGVYVATGGKISAGGTGTTIAAGINRASA